MAELDAQSVDIPCPNCGHETTKTVRWLKTNKDFTCRKCGQEVTIDAKQFREGIKRVEDAIDRLRRGISKR